MSYKFGFEVEYYAMDLLGNITLPPHTWPKDGFPGLIEIRSTGGHDLCTAYTETLKQLLLLEKQVNTILCPTISEYSFTPKQKHQLRKEYSFTKDQQDVCNIYGKLPRDLKGKSIAGCQINISNQISNSYLNKDITIPAQYGALDIYKIVRALDTEFANEIKNSNRQPGMYCIKDNIRLEYRSLPNTAFPLLYTDVPIFLNRIKKCL